MERLFRYRDRWGNGLSLWVVVAALFTLPILYLSLRNLRLENDITTWLPDNDPEARILHWFDHEFEHDSSLLFSWDSSSINDPRVEAFHAALMGPTRKDPQVRGLKEVTSPLDVLPRMLENGIDEQQAVRRLTGLLIGTGFLKIQLSDFGREHPDQARAAVKDLAEDRLGREVDLLPAVAALEPIQIRLPNPPAASSAESDPDRDTTAPDSETPAEGTIVPLSISIPPHDFQLRWSGISPDSKETESVIASLRELTLSGNQLVESAFFAAGAPIALTIAVTEWGEDNLRQTIPEIRSLAESVGIPEDEMRMGGTPIGRYRLSKEALRAVWNRDHPIWNVYRRSPILLSTVVGVLCSYLLLRSSRLATLVVISSLYACALVLALIPATGKTLNIVLVVLPNLLLVLTMSGAIHLANYWKYARAHGDSQPVATAVRMAWKPCLLASVTTAIGMASLITAALSPVREFGIYSSVGCLISLAIILLFFPALLSLWPASGPAKSDQQQNERAVWNAVGQGLVRHRRLVSVACLALFVVSVAGLKWFRTETKVIRYFPPWTRIVQDYDFLEEGLAGIVSIETVVRFTPEAQENLNILQRMELVRGVERDVAQHPWISGAISLADFRPVSEPPPPENARPLDKIRYLRRVQRTNDEIFDKQVASTRAFTKRVSVPLSVNWNGKDVEIGTGDEIWRVRAQASVMGDVDYETLTTDLNERVQRSLPRDAGIDHLITGMVPLFLRTQNAVLESLIESFALAFAVIAVVMIILLRHPVSGLLAMLPNLFPVGIVFGLVSWANVPVDIGTMITASVALGIAIDGTLHLLTWYQDGIRNGLTQQEAVVKSLAHCGPAMWQTSASIALGILMLAGADLLLIRRFGWLMSALITMALIGDVVLFPALLAGGLGRIIARGVAREQDAAKVSSINGGGGEVSLPEAS